MPEIAINPGMVTQITLVEAEPGKQDEILRLMTERAKFMATQPGFVSISLHRSLDGSRVVNYVQWDSKESLQAAHRAPEFRERWPELGRLSEEAVPNLYEPTHIASR
jgi:heme-degrading monooxygenase HmoA